MKRRLVILVSILLLAALPLGWLGFSDAGLRWAWARLVDNLPGELRSTAVEGRLVGPITLREFEYIQDDSRIEAARIVLQWQPLGLLLRGELVLDSVEIETLSIDTEPEDIVEAMEEVFISLPTLDLPFAIGVGQLNVDNLAFNRGKRVRRFDRFEFSGDLRSHRIEIDSARLLADQGELSIVGSLRPEFAYAHELELDWRFKLPSQAQLRGSGSLRGDLQQTRLLQQVDGAARFDLDLEIDDLERRPSWRGRLVIADFDTARLAAGLTPFSGKAEINAAGNLQSARASGALDLQTVLPKPLIANFDLGGINATADYREIVLQDLQLEADNGKLQVDGSLDWTREPAWSLQLELENFDPSGLAPQWPGRISASIQTDGALHDDGAQAQIRIDRLNGSLRDYPVALEGGLRWQGNAVELQQIEFASGDSRLALAGSIDQQIALQWRVDSPDLGQLYPRASGRLEATGELFGPRETPGIHADFSGRRVALAGVGAERLAGRLSLSRLASLELEQLAGKLQMQLDADDVTFDERRLERVEIDADGGRITLAVNSGEARLQVALDGAASESGWSGSLVSARLVQPELGDWSLARPAPLELLPDKIRLHDACAAEKLQGRLCVSVDGGNGDWQLDGEIRELPLSRLQPWLTPDLQLDGTADLDADLRLTDGRQLLGKLAVKLAPGVMRYRLQAEQSETIDYRGGSIEANLGNSGIEARAKIGLRPRESLDIELALPAANLWSLDPATQQLRASTRLVLTDIGVAETLFTDIDRLRGGIEVDARFTGRLKQPRISGTARLADAGFSLPKLGLRVDELNGQAHSDGLESAEYRLVGRIAGGRAELEGSTGLDPESGWPSRLRLRGNGFTLAPLLGAYLPQDMQVDGGLAIDADLELALPDRLTGEIVLGVSGGSLVYPLVDDKIDRWTLADTELQIRLQADGVSANTSLRIGDNHLRGAILLPDARVLALDPARQPLRGDVDFEFEDLSLLATLMSEVQQPRGTLDGRLELGGTLAAPAFGGSARLRKASLQLPRLGIEIENIVADAQTDDDGRLEFTASGRSGEGNLEITGSSRLEAASGWPTELRITGEDFLIAQVPEANVTASPRLELRIGDYAIDIRGEVFLPFARLEPRDLSTAARVSTDAVVTGAEQPEQRRWQITSDVQLLLGDRVSFFGYGFEGQLGGYLKIEETPGRPTSGTGIIDIVEGRYRAYGQHLDVSDGRLLFAGGPLTNPGIDVRAVRQVGDVTAGISVSGLLGQPQVELFSDPAMGQTDTLSYLLTGGPLETADSEQGAMMANAAIALGLSGGDRIARSLGSRFGFEDMRVESSSSGEQASLIMGRYLSSRLYVSYGIGLIESINTLNLRYQLSRRWRIEAESGEEHGADLLYTIER